MLAFTLTALGVIYLIGFLVALTALENYKRPTFRDLVRHLGLSLAWPVILTISAYQAYRAEK